MERAGLVAAADFGAFEADGDAVNFLEAAGDETGGEINALGDLDAVDVDGDGAVEVIANHETSSFSVLRNDGNGAFASAPGSPFATGAQPHIHGLATGDFNRDGRIDVAVESADTREVRVLMGTGDGFASATPVPVRTMPYSRLGVGDTNRDGTLDILVPGHGDSTLVAGDIDADGNDDLIVVETNGVSLWLAIGLAIADLNGDGKGEPLATCTMENRLAVASVTRP